MSAFELPDRIFNEIIRLSRQYYREAEKCREANAFLAGCIMIGSALEAMLLAFANCYPEEASNSTAVPRKRNGVVKPLIDWSQAFNAQTQQIHLGSNRERRSEHRLTIKCA